MAPRGPARDKGGSLFAGRMARVGGSRSWSCSWPQLPFEALDAQLPSFFGRARPVGRLACTARFLKQGLADADGRLRVSAMVTCRIHSVIEGLERASLPSLEVLRLDLSSESREKLCRKEIEHMVRHLSEHLAGASSLRVLAVRLASFDASMERLRLGKASWEALIRGLGALAEHQRLQVLELSSIAIKTTQAQQVVEPQEPHRQLRRASSAPASASASAASPTAQRSGAGLTFLDVLRKLSELEELVLTYDEIFACTAQLLPPVLREMACLRKLDLTRNHIPKQVMRAVREAMPPKVQLCGDDQQTFFFY